MAILLWMIWKASCNGCYSAVRMLRMQQDSLYGRAHLALDHIRMEGYRENI